MNKKFILPGVIGIGLILAGLIYGIAFHRPYEEQKYVDVASHESLILVPLDGDSLKNQAKLKSKEYYEQHKVASKRVPLIAKWHKTGRLPSSGKWIYPYDAIKVSRAPITLDWTDDSDSGTSSHKQALRAQTKDDIGFRQGFTIQANITEEQVATFAYNYPKSNLKVMLDNEVRPYAETEFNKLVKGFTLVELSEKSKSNPELTNEKWIYEELSKKVTNIYSSKGITIANIGPKDKKIFDNKGIQESIDKVFITNQLEETAKKQREIDAKDAENRRDIQEKENELKLRIATNEAKTKRDILTADSEAQSKANERLSKSLTPGLIELKKLEAQLEVFNKWNGEIPVQYGTGSTPSLLKLIKE